MIRAYTSIERAQLAALRSSGSFRPGQVFAVTAQVEALAPGAGEELHEHLATQFAAASAVADPVVVAAVDLAPGRVAVAEGAPGLVTCEGSIGRQDVVCFLVADPGARVSDDADLELSWYDAGEMESVAALLA